MRLEFRRVVRLDTWWSAPSLGGKLINNETGHFPRRTQADHGFPVEATPDARLPLILHQNHPPASHGFDPHVRSSGNLSGGLPLVAAAAVGSTGS